jgi:flavin-dependent dehydrogenase
MKSGMLAAETVAAALAAGSAHTELTDYADAVKGSWIHTDLNRVRNAMDGVLPDGTTLQFEPRAQGQGFNSILRTTRRQNFLVPPRAHRSFPLSEL